MGSIYYTTTTVEQALKLGIPAIETGEYDSEDDLQRIHNVAIENQINLVNIGGIEDLKRHVLNHHPLEIWNLNSGIFGSMRETHAPGLIESAGIVCRGADTALCAITQDKLATSALIEKLQLELVEFLPTWLIVGPEDIQLRGFDKFIIKPRFEGSSRGIGVIDMNKSNISEETLDSLCRKWGQYIAQPYIEGFDISMNFGLDASGKLMAYPPLFTKSNGGVDTAEFKTYDAGYCPQKMIISFPEFNESIIRDAWKIARFFNPDLYLRIDLRMCEATGRIFFLEVNATPTLSPYDDYIKSAERAGFSFDQVLLHIFKKLLIPRQRKW